MKIKRRHVVLASLVLALGVAVYVNWNISSADDLNSKELGKATYVNSNVEATADEVNTSLTESLTKEQQNYFSNARLKRQETFDEVKNLALEALTYTDTDEDAKESALAQLARLEENLMNQDTVENTLIAKGYSDVVCSINDNSATVIVPANEITDSSTIVIKDAVSQVCNLPFESISIVTV